MRFTAYFETVDKLKYAYYNLIWGNQKDYVTDIQVKVEGKVSFKIVVNMGIEAKTRTKRYLPQIGEAVL